MRSIDGERVALRIVERSSGGAGVFRLQRRAVEFGQAFAPEIERIEVPAGVSFPEAREKRIGARARGGVAARRSAMMEEL